MGGLGVKSSLTGVLAFAISLMPTKARSQIPQVSPEEERAVERLDLQILLETPVEVWTPTKAPQRRQEAPAIVTTVTRDQIVVWGYRSIAELLSHQLGFYVVDDHRSPNLAVRGNSGGLYSNSSIIKVLINGQPIPFTPTGGTGLGPELIPLSAIERVEIIRGPASALYGADAFLGMVNIRTRGGGDVAGATAWLAGGLVGEKPAVDLEASLGAAGGGVETLIAVRRSQLDLSGLPLPVSSPAPRIPAYHTGPLVAEGLDQDSRSAIGTVTYRPRPGRSVGLFAYYSLQDSGDEFGSVFQLAHGFDESGVFSENRVSRDQLRIALQIEEQLSKRLDLSLRSSYFQGGTGEEDRLEVGSEFYFVRRSLGFRGVDADVQLDWALAQALSLTAGTTFQHDDERLPSRVAVAKRRIEGVEANPGDVIETATVRQGRKTFRNVGTYLQGNWQPLGGRLGLTAGLRYDYHNVYRGQLSRRLGLVGSPTSTIHIKLLHGSAFQAPSPFLMHAVPLIAGDVAGNQDLEPQYVNTFELQLAYEPAEWMNLSSTAAYNRLNNRTEFIQQGVNLEARNVLRTDSYSWENQLEVRASHWLHASLSFELNRTRTRSDERTYLDMITGGQAGIYPHLMIHAGVAASLGDLLRGAVMLSYFGRRRSSGTNTLLNRGAYELPVYLQTDINLATRGFQFSPERRQTISFSVSVKNLLEATGPSPGFNGVDYPLSPRALFVQSNLEL
jgi:iron complex outermembrane receptor protein